MPNQKDMLDNKPIPDQISKEKKAIKKVAKKTSVSR